MMQENEMGEDFSLPDQDGRLVTLSSFRGSWVILYFYPKDNTPGCTTEACDFSSQSHKNITILGISPDTTESHQNFIKKHALNITLLSDTEKSVIKKYGAWGMNPKRGKEGLIRTTFLIDPTGKVKKIWKNVSVDGHVQLVFEILKNLTLPY